MCCTRQSAFSSGMLGTHKKVIPHLPDDDYTHTLEGAAIECPAESCQCPLPHFQNTGSHDCHVICSRKARGEHKETGFSHCNQDTSPQRKRHIICSGWHLLTTCADGATSAAAEVRPACTKPARRGGMHGKGLHGARLKMSGCGGNTDCARHSPARKAARRTACGFCSSPASSRRHVSSVSRSASAGGSPRSAAAAAARLASAMALPKGFKRAS